MSLCGVATLRPPEQLEISAAEAVIDAMERVPRRPHIAKNENRFSFIESTPVASHQPMNEKRLINKANGSIIVGYARAENGAGGRQCRCPPWRAKRRMLADVFHWRQIRSAAGV